LGNFTGAARVDGIPSLTIQVQTYLNFSNLPECCRIATRVPTRWCEAVPGRQILWNTESPQIANAANLERPARIDQEGYADIPDQIDSVGQFDCADRRPIAETTRDHPQWRAEHHFPAESVDPISKAYLPTGL
jgi:hypothetical protein